MLPCAISRRKNWSHETDSAVSPRESSLVLYTQAESGAYSQDSSRFRRRRISTPSTAIGSVPSLWCYVNTYRWHSPPRVRRYRASSPQGGSGNGCCLFRYRHGANHVRPFFSITIPNIGCATGRPSPALPPGCTLVYLF